MATLDGMHWLEAGDRLLHAAWNEIPHGFVGRRPPTSSTLPHVRRCRQVHGVQLVDAAQIPPHSAPLSNPPEADGVYTSERGVSCGVQTADCLPVLFHSQRRPFAAAVHAGWRGLTAGVLAEAVAIYRNMGSPADLLVGIGPAISLARFEVGPEVVAAIRQGTLGLHPEQSAHVLTKGLRDRWHVDLATAAGLHLNNLGIPAEQIYIMRSCTWEEEARWYSFRREGRGCGMNISWIG